MSQEPPTRHEEVESTVDRFEHEIEELEKPMGIGPRQWLVGVAIMAAIVGAFLVGSMMRQSGQPDASRSNIAIIETIQPRSGLLYDKPTTFRWDSVARTSQYVLSIREYQGNSDLIVRETPTSTVELTESEISRLAKGGRYQWNVKARSAEGWTIGEGNGSFSL